MNAVEIYLKVIDGSLPRFPNGFWDDGLLVKEKEVITYMFENILKWDKEDICKNLSKKTFIYNKLGGMLVMVFNSSPYQALNIAYPSEFKPWELKRAPLRTWDIDTAKLALKWVIEVKNNLSDTNLIKEYGSQFIRKNGLKVAVSLFENEFDYIDAVYPGKFKPWNFRQCPKNYWTERTKLEAIRWLVYERLNLSGNDIVLRKKNFDDNGLTSLLHHHFNGSWRDAVSFLLAEVDSSNNPT